MASRPTCQTAHSQHHRRPCARTPISARYRPQDASPSDARLRLHGSCSSSSAALPPQRLDAGQDVVSRVAPAYRSFTMSRRTVSELRNPCPRQSAPPRARAAVETRHWWTTDAEVEAALTAAPHATAAALYGLPNCDGTGAWPASPAAGCAAPTTRSNSSSTSLLTPPQTERRRHRWRRSGLPSPFPSPALIQTRLYLVSLVLCARSLRPMSNNLYNIYRACSVRTEP